MSSYNDLRNLILQSAPRLQTLRVYVSENENLQSEWVLTEIFHDLESNRMEEVRDRAKRWLQSAKDWHKEIWPDRQVADIKPSFKAHAQKVKKSKENWKKEHAEQFDQTTVPTTIMICILFQLATNVKRVSSARELGMTVAQSLQTCL